MAQTKKTGLMLCLAAVLAWGMGTPASEAYTISLSPTFLEHRADVSALYAGSQVGPAESVSQPYAFAELGDRVGAPASLWAYNGRGVTGPTFDNHNTTEGNAVWSEALLGFGGESGYFLPGSGFFLDSVTGNSISRVSYSLSLQPLYAGSANAETIFSIESYQSTYPQQAGIDVWQSITLKDPSSGLLFQWSGDLTGRTAALSLQSGEIYTLLIESHGDFGDQVLLGGTAGGSFLSHGELRVRVSEQVAIPAPDSLVLLVSALGGWLALRKKLGALRS
jgi:hypothetical protein